MVRVSARHGPTGIYYECRILDAGTAVAAHRRTGRFSDLRGPMDGSYESTRRLPAPPGELGGRASDPRSDGIAERIAVQRALAIRIPPHGLVGRRGGARRSGCDHLLRQRLDLHATGDHPQVRTCAKSSYAGTTGVDCRLPGNHQHAGLDRSRDAWTVGMAAALTNAALLSLAMELFLLVSAPSFFGTIGQIVETLYYLAQMLPADIPVYLASLNLPLLAVVLLLGRRNRTRSGGSGNDGDRAGRRNGTPKPESDGGCGSRELDS